MGFSKQEYWSGVPLPSPTESIPYIYTYIYIYMYILVLLSYLTINTACGGLVAQSCPTLCDHMNCSLSGSSIHGILQARILEWIAISFSRGSS